MNIEFLLVSCCLDRSRAQILSQVVDNLREQASEICDYITVFDNASTEAGVIDLLRNNFKNVYRSNCNVGYWSAVDWWLENLSQRQTQPKYTYIIESDMIHYAFNKIWTCASYLDSHENMGSVRLHEYSVANKHLYNKDAPVPGSKALWQSHTNKITGKKITLQHSEGDIFETTFLTQLPALNRFETIKKVFNELSYMKNFSEIDFQSKYHEKYDHVAILDGGIFNCDLAKFGSDVITGSWTPAQTLAQLGYQPTRLASITPRDKYTVVKV